MQYRLVQRHGPGRQFLARRASNRSADCRRGCPRVGVELPMEENLRRERLPGSQVHRIQRLLQSRSGRPVSVHVRRADGRVLLRRRRGLLYNDRSRNQVQVALTKYAEKFGRHSLKFGLEIERSHVRNVAQPYGPADFYIYTYGGVPYYQYSYGYDIQADNKRTSAFVQDQWTAGKLTLNLGLRLDHIRGKQPDSEQGCLHARHSLGTADRCRLRSHRQGDDGAEGVLRAVLRRGCDRVLRRPRFPVWKT